jgi:hypothetical protein
VCPTYVFRPDACDQSVLCSVCNFNGFVFCVESQRGQDRAEHLLLGDSRSRVSLDKRRCEKESSFIIVLACATSARHDLSSCLGGGGDDRSNVFKLPLRDERTELRVVDSSPDRYRLHHRAKAVDNLIGDRSLDDEP